MSPLSSELTAPRESTAPQARAFVRSLNVLLKYARLYGLEHSRSAAQFVSTWDELQEAVRAAGQTGLLLGASGSQLLLDGVPLDSTPAERSFADLLDASGIASICFSPSVDRDEFTNLVKAFMETGQKARTLTERLEHCFGKNAASGIRVNEIRFVPEDAALADARVVTQLAAKTLGADAGNLQEWFRSPEKMIQLIAAAEGAHSGLGSGSGPGSGGGMGAGSAAGAGAGPGGDVTAGMPAAPAAIAPLEEADLKVLLRLLGQFGEAAHGRNTQDLDPAAWQQKMGSLPLNARATLRQALASVAANTSSPKLDEAMLLRLAEDLAIRFALDRFQRGEVRVNAVRQLLDRMGQELETLRKILKSREEKMAGAGLSMESHADLLDRQFWAAVPDSGKRAVLTSPDAWCIPPRNVQQYVEELLARGESETAGAILLRYASCVRNKDAEARKKAAIGLSQLAELYSKTASRRLEDALLQIGQQMSGETDLELQTLLGAAFVRLSQEAASRRYYRAMQQSLDSLADLEELRPSWAQSLRPRTGIENRVSEFIEDVLVAEAMPEGMTGVLMRIPQAAGEQLALRLARSARCTERENIVELAKAVGGPCLAHLREILKSEPPARAVSVVGLFSRLDPLALEDLLPPRLGNAGRAFQDAVVRQLSVAGAPERGRLLANSLELFADSVLPLALDEIGMCGDPDTAPKLLRVAQGEIIPQGADYLRVKAIEALGRMRAPAAAGHLRLFVEARKAFGWSHPEEIRMAAAQALMKIDPEWIRKFLPHSGLEAREMAFAPLDPVPGRDIVRYRRHPRIRLPRAVPAEVTSTRGRYSSAISVLSLEGGLLHGDIQFPVGTEATLKIPVGLRSIRMKAVVRFVRSHQAGFETIGMALEDRSKLRRLLVSLAGK
ncbi:MAG: PilZ domain-containing protein [Candidatus Acidiferrales bacterium]